MRTLWTSGLWVVVLACPAWAVPAPESPAEKSLRLGNLAEGVTILEKHLKLNPKDDSARLSLGTVQFLQGVERLTQGFYRYGLGSGTLRDNVGRNLPFLRLPVPLNLKPEKYRYADQVKLLQTFVDDLERAEKTLAGVPDGDVKLPVRLALYRLDLDGDGKPEEPLGKLFARMTGVEMKDEDFEKFQLTFDAADAHWLRGYCHLLMFMGEFILAHDFEEIFDATAHLFFADPVTPFEFLKEHENNQGGWWDSENIADLIAAVHLLRMPVTKPAKKKAALAHLEAMSRESRQMWKLALAETDDDHEWIPNPKQTGILRTPITKEMIDTWLVFLDELDDILAGKRLVPFWRGKDGRDGKVGINLRGLLLESKRFDLMLWIQGSGVKPYLEQGKLTRPETWRRLQNVFQGNFIGFAVWVN